MLPYIVLIVILLLVSVVLVGSYVFYRGLLYQTPTEPGKSQDEPTNLPNAGAYASYVDRMNADWKVFHDEKYEPVTITADDGTKLFARYYHHGDGAPLALLFHGYKGNSLRDGMGGYQILFKQGYNVLLPDQRAHGMSEGHSITLGIKERYDCLAWANYAAKRFGPDTPIFLMGVSMGAATVMMATGLNLPKNVVGVIEDCGYTSPGEIGRKCIRQWFHVPDQPLYCLGRIGARLFAGVDLESGDSRKALASTKLPVLFIHGDADDFVPCDMGRENYAACGSEKQLYIVPGAPHAMAYYFDTPGYTKTVTEFCDKVLAKWKLNHKSESPAVAEG